MSRKVPVSDISFFRDLGTGRRKISFSKGTFVVDGVYIGRYKVTVLGNIYENPELLEN